MSQPAPPAVSLDPRDRKKRFCIMPTCKGERFDLVHKFPMDNERAEMWRRIIDIPELSQCPIEDVRKNKFICSRHFRQEDYKNIESRSLNKTAMPSQNIKTLDNQHAGREKPPDDCAKQDTDESIEFDDKDLKFIAPVSSVSKVYSKKITVSPSKKRKHNVFPLETSNPSGNENIIDLDSQSPIKKSLLTTISQLSLPDSTCLQNQSDKIVPVTPSTPQKIEILSVASLNLDIEPLYEQSFVIDPIIQVRELSDILRLDQIQENKNLSISSTDTSINIYPDDATIDTLELGLDWLRDYCRCSECWCSKTMKRLKDLPYEVHLSSYSFDDNQLRIVWSDSHKSAYDIKDLYNCKSNKCIEENASNPEIYLWDSIQIKDSNYARLSLFDFLQNAESDAKVVSSLLKYGIAFIENMPCNESSANIAIAKLFRIQKMESFNIEERNQLPFTEPSSRQAFLNYPVGLEIYNWVDGNGRDGEFCLVDGFRILNELKLRDPKAYKNLSRICVEYIYESGVNEYCFVGPIVKLDCRTLQPEQIRFNPYYRSTPKYLPQEDIHVYYQNWSKVSQLIQSAKYQWNVKLKPGTLMLIDNWRILSGNRVREEGYKIRQIFVSRDEFLNVVRKIGFRR